MRIVYPKKIAIGVDIGGTKIKAGLAAHMASPALLYEKNPLIPNYPYGTDTTAIHAS